jgi:hypothetical protein
MYYLHYAPRPEEAALLADAFRVDTVSSVRHDRRGNEPEPSAS